MYVYIEHSTARLVTRRIEGLCVLLLLLLLDVALLLQTKIELRLRYPLMGSWKTDFTLGENTRRKHTTASEDSSSAR
jgi:hypothetical protein